MQFTQVNPLLMWRRAEGRQKSQGAGDKSGTCSEMTQHSLANLNDATLTHIHVCLSQFVSLIDCWHEVSCQFLILRQRRKYLRFLKQPWVFCCIILGSEPSGLNQCFSSTFCRHDWSKSRGWLYWSCRGRWWMKVRCDFAVKSSTKTKTSSTHDALLGWVGDALFNYSNLVTLFDFYFLDQYCIAKFELLKKSIKWTLGLCLWSV